MADWATDRFQGPPPWPRGLRPGYLLLSLVLFFGLLAVFWLAVSGRLL